MDYRKFGNQIVLRVDRDEEVMTEITALCEKENVHLASISGLFYFAHDAFPFQRLCFFGCL